MALYDIGRVCVKIAGRDAGKKCVIVDAKDAFTVMVDGETRRRPCNVRHLEPLAEKVELKKGASHADVKAALKKIGIEVRETKPKKAAEKPVAVRNVKEKPEPKPKKAAAEKATKPAAEKAPKAKAESKAEPKDE